MSGRDQGAGDLTQHEIEELEALQREIYELGNGHAEPGVEPVQRGPVIGNPLVFYLEVHRRSDADDEHEPHFRHFECGCSDRSCDQSILRCVLCSEVLHTGDDYFSCVAYRWDSSDGGAHSFEICTECGPDHRSARVAALNHLTDGKSNPRVIGITHCNGGQA